MHPLRLLPVVPLVLLTACNSAPAPTRSGFLTAYDALETRSASRSDFTSPDLATYTALLIDPVEVRVDADTLPPEQATLAAEHFHAAAVRVATEAGIPLTDTPGPTTARLRLALTDVATSIWWAKIHPAARVSGAGTGGAAMEGEITDSLTGAQLAASVRADSGNQFNLTNFSTLDDVKSAIDRWAADAARQLREARDNSAP
ncbi:MAG: DUF3313 domain-containing protein [Phycisphaerales bacterium JB041]